jgi:hypothetical protein
MISVNASNQEEFVREFLSYAWHTQWGREDIFFVDLKSKGRAAFGLPPFERGVLIDGGFDRGGLVFNFPVIDGRDEKTGEVSSVKSYDLSAKRYQSINSLNSTIYNDARELSEYQGTSPKGYGGIPIDPSEIKSRILLVVVPLLGATDDQLNYLYTVASTNPNPFDFPKKRSVDIMIFVVD